MPPLLEIRDLTTRFLLPEGPLTAIDRLNLKVDRGEVLGLVGESGCGKSMTALSVLGLVPPPGRIVQGQIRFDGRDLVQLTEPEMRTIRGKRIAMIFQEPMTALNPVFTAGEQVAEMLRLHLRMSRRDARDRTIELFRLVGIPSAEHRIRDYPHQLSGGLRQRVMIAMAISCEPELVFADEPTTALDVTIQAQILALLARLQEQMGMAMVLISHDLGVIAQIANRVAVMYAGRIVESASVEQLFAHPLHPYTRGLLDSLPRLDAPASGRLRGIPGSVPRLSELPSGCTFSPRCALVEDRCRASEPPLEPKNADHHSRCWVVNT